MYPDQQPQQNPAPTPQPQQVTPLPQPPLPPQAPYQPTEEPLPGKTLGILGFIFAFIFLSGIGLVLSIMSLVKAKRAGRKNGLAIAGIVLNVFSMIFATGLLLAITLATFNGVSSLANTTSAKTSATSVVNQAEAFHTSNFQYPTSYSMISSAVGSSVTQTKTTLTSEPSTPDTIEFYDCGVLGNKVGYWDYSISAVAYTYTAEASSTTSCTFVTE